MNKVKKRPGYFGLAFVILYLTNIFLMSSISAAMSRGGLNVDNLTRAIVSLSQEPIILLLMLIVTWVMFLVMFTDDGWLLFILWQSWSG